MNTMEMWQQAMQTQEGDVSCMDDVAVYKQWVSEVQDDRCPFCQQPVVVKKAVVCPNAACLFKTVTYRVLMEYGVGAA